MDLRPTQSNLTERETGSDLEALIDPVGEGEEVAGPSSHPSSDIPPATSSVAPQDPATTGQEAAPPPTAAPHPGSQDDPGNSSSPTVPLETSPQPAVISRRGRRRRELQESRRNVDTEGLFKYLFIERWQLLAHNVLRRPLSQQVHAQQVFQAPPPHVPTPLPVPTQNPPRPAYFHMPSYHQPSQYGHLSRPSAGGWSQPGFEQHSHVGGVVMQGLIFHLMRAILKTLTIANTQLANMSKGIILSRDRHHTHRMMDNWHNKGHLTRTLSFRHHLHQLTEICNENCFMRILFYFLF
ncbi:uncharacterized protein LOC143816928 [Ranitomeya variabilis]|uniref:uncharacterized protein LOC143816928 n=1 Tax=Ranitomeya variabilis TaxID=490064 RepID=UPI00405706B0